MPRTATAPVTAPAAEQATRAPRMETNCICCNRKLNGMLRSPEISSLCTLCYDEAGYSNAHSDGNHSEQADAGCYLCTGTDPHAGIRTRVASGLQGKVVDAATDRRIKGLAAAPAADAAVLSFPARPTLRGKAAPAYAGLTYQVLQEDHRWAGHLWTQVRVTGAEKNKWFWKEELVVRPARTRRNAAAA